MIKKINSSLTFLTATLSVACQVSDEDPSHVQRWVTVSAGQLFGISQEWWYESSVMMTVINTEVTSHGIWP